MTKEKTEICGICRMKIYLNKDNYCHLIDYRAGKFVTEGFYHTRCYNEKMSGGEKHKKMMNQAFQLLKKAREITGIEEPMEVYEIK